MLRRMQLFQPLKFQKISIFFIIKIIHCGIFDTWLIFPFPPNFPWFFFKVPHSISAFKMALNFWMCCMENYVLE